MKLCEDCKHNKDGKCVHSSQVIVQHQFTRVKSYRRPKSTRRTRSSGLFGFFKGACGPDAKLFEKKEDKINPRIHDNNANEIQNS